MKTIQKLLIAAVLLLSAAIYSCQKQKTSDVTKPDILNDLKLNEVKSPKEKLISWEPEGSKIEETQDGYLVTPPAGWGYAGLNREGVAFNLVSYAGKTISCTCNNTSGKCKPFHASGPGGTISGCGGECTDCTMKQSSSMQDFPIDIHSGGYYHISAPIKILKNGESAPAVFDALAQLPAFKLTLSKFFTEAFAGSPQQYPVKLLDGSIEPPKGHSLIGISIMGRGMVVVVPDRFAVKHLGFTNQAKASCSCSKGTCVLKDWKVLGTGAVWCDGECTTCTLTTDSRQQNSPYSVSLQAYRF